MRTLNAMLGLLGVCMAPPPDGAWKLVWSDEFDKELIDPKKWTFEVNGRGGGNRELQYYTDRHENARVENGHLVIEARKESFTGRDGTRSYTSARMVTKNKGDWLYGAVEVRAKLPEGKGMWPAIWMMPTDAAYGGWPSSGEIDIMESLGHDPATVYGTIHFGGPGATHASHGSSFKLTAGRFSDDFHLFRFEWEPEAMRWYVDGRLYATQTDWHSKNHPHPAPFDKRFHLILNLAVGGNWPGSPDGSTNFPQSMLVDYARVYQKG